MSTQGFIDFHRLILEVNAFGVIVLDRRLNILFWNRFMEVHSHLSQDEVVNRKITSLFPELSEKWLEKKVRSVALLKNRSFTSYTERPHFLKFPTTQQLLDDEMFMYQDCLFSHTPSENGEFDAVCIIVKDVSELQAAQKLLLGATEQAVEFQETSIRDPLTSLYNRQYFFEQMRQDIARCRRFEWHMGIAMIDLDHFKSVNDTYGHQAGDEALKRTAAELQRCLRASDTVCRFGGEEFIVIMPNVGTGNAQVICERLRSGTEKLDISYDGRPITVTASLGYTDVLPGENDITAIIERADKALYKAKEEGRNCTRCL